MSRLNILQNIILIASLLICFCALLSGFISWSSESRADNWRADMSELVLISGEIRAGGQDEITLSKLPLRLREEVSKLNGVEAAAHLRPETLGLSASNETTVADFLLSDNVSFKTLGLDKEFGVMTLTPDTIILKDSLAETLSVTIGDTINVDFESGVRTLRIIALHRTFPGDSHLQFDAMAHFDENLYSDSRPYLETFASFDTQLYARLSPTTDETAIEVGIVATMRDRLAAEFGPEFSSQIDFVSADIVRLPELKAQSDHLRLTYGRPTSPTVYRLSLLAAGILFLVGIANYLIMSLVRANHRLKAAAIKKCLGVKQSHFFMEELKRIAILAGPVLILSIPFAIWVARTGLDIENAAAYLLGSGRVTILILLILAMTLLGLAVVPAGLTASASPRDALTGKVSSSGWGGALRYALLGFQLTTAFALIGLTVTKSFKLNQVLTGDRGFQAENLIIVENAGVLGEQISVLETLLMSQGAETVSFAANAPGDITTNSAGIRLSRDNTPLLVNREEVGYKFFTALQADVIHGSDFSEDQDTQTSFKPVILTFDLARTLFGNADASLIGQTVILDGLQRDSIEAEIIGIVHPAKFAADYHSPAPTFYYYEPKSFQSGLARLSPSISAEDIAAFFADQYPDLPLTIVPVTQTLAAYYDADKIAYRRLIFLSSFAVFLAFSAAYGTTLQLASQARHELNLRRIIGAPMSHITAKLLTPVTLIAVISSVVGTGIVIWVNQMQGGEFGMASPLSLLIALCVVSLGLFLAVTPLLLRLKSSDPAKMMLGAIG